MPRISEKIYNIETINNKVVLDNAFFSEYTVTHYSDGTILLEPNKLAKPKQIKIKIKSEKFVESDNKKTCKKIKRSSNPIFIEIGNWKIQMKKWWGDKYRKTLIRNDKKVDIISLDDVYYRIYSSNNIETLKLDHKVNSKSEPRPYIYVVNRKDLENIFLDLDYSLIDNMDYDKHVLSEGDK